MVNIIHDQYTNLPMKASLKHYYRHKDSLLFKEYRKRDNLRKKIKYNTDPEHKKKKRDYAKEYLKKNKEISNKKYREYRARIRREVLIFVGGEMGLKCKRCNFDDIRALQIDHVNGGGRQEIRKFRDNSRYIKHIKKNPENYQLLCANCNWIKKVENNEVRYVAKKPIKKEE